MIESKRIYPSDNTDQNKKPNSLFSTISNAVGHFVGVLTGKKLEIEIIWNNPNDIYFGTSLSNVQLNATVSSNNSKAYKYLQNLDGKFVYNPPIGSILEEGSHELECIYDVGSSNDAKKFNKLTKKVVVINILPKVIPMIKWNDKSLRHNDIITENFFDAKCIDTNGTFTYNIKINTIINIKDDGSNITAKFDPIDNVKYNSVLKTIKITVLKALPSIVWDPSPLYMGQPISKEQLNATVVEDELIDGCKFEYFPNLGHIFDVENNEQDINNYDNNDENEDEEILYNLIINDLYAKNLVNFGTRFDMQDPGLIIRIGDMYSFITDRVQDGGSNASFPEVFKDICISQNDIDNGITIEVEAHNMDSKNKSKNLLGTGFVKLIDAIPKKNEKCNFVIELKNQGEIKMCGILSTLCMNENKEESLVKLMIENISVRNLQNVGTMMDAADPGVIIKIGNLHTFKTDRLCDAGTSADFHEKFSDILLNENDINAGLLLEFEVHNMDKNLNSKKLIGKGNIFIADAISALNCHTAVSIPLAPKGTLSFDGTLIAVIDDDDNKVDRTGPVRIRLDKLSITDVENRGTIYDKQDPGIILHVGHYTLKTDRIAEGGTEASFPEVFEEIDVHYEDYLEVEVHNFDGSGRSKTCIGKGSVILCDVVKKQHKLVDITIPLTNSKGKQQGKFFLRCTLEKIISDVSAVTIGPKSRIKLNLDQLSIRNVENTGSWTDKQDPSLSIKVGKVYLKTDRVQDGGTTCDFNETFEVLCNFNEHIEVEVHNCDSKGNSKKRIGKGKVKISQMLSVAGVGKGITIYLTNSKHKHEGVVRMRAVLEVLPVSNSAITLTYEPPPKMKSLYDTITITKYVKMLPKKDYKLSWDMKSYTYCNSRLYSSDYFSAVADVSGYGTYYYYNPCNTEGNEWIVLTEETFLPLGLHHVCVTFKPELPIYMVEHVYRTLFVRPKSIPWIDWDSPIYMNSGPLTETQLSASSIVPGKFEFSHSVGDMMDVCLQPGHLVRTRFTPYDLDQYTIEEKETFIIVPKIPSILWTVNNCNSKPHSNMNILYEGQPLSEDELCISVLDQDLVGKGTVLYEPKQGEVLTIGQHTIQATYIVDDDVFKNIYQKETIVTIPITVIKKIDPIIIWSDPQPIRCGQQLKKSELNATCDIEGEFKYFPPLGHILPKALDGTTLKCVFHPQNKIKYNTVSKQVTIFVLKAFAKIYWTLPKFLYEGQPLTEKQLNAKILTEELSEGLFEYFPPLNTVLPVGLHDLIVRVQPPSGTEDNYDVTEYKVNITIKAQKVPEVLWSSPDFIFEGMPLTNQQLNASCPRNRGKFKYNPPIDTIMNDIGLATLSVTFEPENSIEYCPVEKTVELEVKEKLVPVLTWTNPSPIFYGRLLNETILNAGCDNEDGVIEYFPPFGTKLMVSDENNPHILKATFIPNDKSRYLQVENTVFLTVKKSTPRIKWPHQGKIFEHTPLPSSLFCAKIIDEELQIEGGKFIYNPSSGETLGLGEHMLMVVYEPPAELLDRFTVASAFTKVRVIPHKQPIDNSVQKVLPGWEIGKDRRVTLFAPPEPKDFANTNWGTR